MSATEWAQRFEELASEAAEAGYDVRVVGHCCPDAWVEVTIRTDSNDTAVIPF